ncbi:hypothetical protein [Neisseria yangbaofengii]|uniref:hypothetical protein n=1 Tax=Neisseria yangbaofengii TaxID=2709396 RepID=UPI0013EDC5B2|nr:hypothetical protein [Neisseria yangbaofengii]
MSIKKPAVREMETIRPPQKQQSQSGQPKAVGSWCTVYMQMVQTALLSHIPGLSAQIRHGFSNCFFQTA